ncbi:MAG: F0F1 ATP synthase subunit alpha, partial [Candidatus Pacebacteria bacterium]|nr:F0F1 ATP synthase subunit alpha [Candidatus Paceibacterota bacterium]
VAGKLRLELAQFRELAAFAQFSSDLDKETKERIERGKRLVEVLKQGQYDPMETEDQVAIIFATINGFLDNVEVEKVKDFERDMLDFLRDKNAHILEDIAKEGKISDETEKDLKDAINDFKEKQV